MRADDVLRHDRRGLRVDDHHRVVADDDAGVRIAFGRVGVRVVGQLVEADLLLVEVGLRREFLFAHGNVPEVTLEGSTILADLRFARNCG